LIHQTVATYGRLDIAFNNAGAEGAFSPFVDETNETYETIFNANMRGVFWCMKHEGKAMLAQGNGSIDLVAEMIERLRVDDGDGPNRVARPGGKLGMETVKRLREATADRHPDPVRRSDRPRRSAQKMSGGCAPTARAHLPRKNYPKSFQAGGGQAAIFRFSR
jgi:Enoyl-(Acyl carrier protein) reductase